MISVIESRNQIIQEDLNKIAEYFKPHLDRLENKTILVTGATGLIGKYIVLSLLTMSRVYGVSCKVVAQGRSLKRLEETFSLVASRKNLILWAVDLTSPLKPNCPVNLVIHAASPTASKEFVERPVEVIDSIYQSTLNVLRLSELENVESVVYLSSMEMYGEFTEERRVTEDDCGQLDILSLRSSYPLAKRLSELLCFSFAKEKQVSAKIARLSMVYGPGLEENDERVLNYFTRQIAAQKPITLLTEGKSRASVLYTREAAQAILFLLLFGESGEAYNVANPQNYYSIYEMACIAASIKHVPVLVSNGEISNSAYRRDSFLNLEISKIQALGWSPKVSLGRIYERTLMSWNS